MSFDWLSAAQLGAGLGQWIGGAANQARQNQIIADTMPVTIDYLEEAINDLNEQKSLLGTAYQFQQGAITDEYGNRFGSMMDKYNSGLSKTGMQYSGGLANQARRDVDNMRSATGAKLGQLSTQFDSELSSIDRAISDMNQQIKQSQIQYDYAKDRDKWYQNLF
jgi:hypothetical protein